MRVSIFISTYVSRAGAPADELVEDPTILSRLDGWTYGEEPPIACYLDEDLVDVGLTGGNIRAQWSDQRGLEIVVDYWVPEALGVDTIDHLRADTCGQMSDGVGECGFDVTANGVRYHISCSDSEGHYIVEQVDDGVPAPGISRVAKAARDGDLAALKQAIESGEPVDGLRQGYTGLHLAILYGHADAALILIEAGANPNYVDIGGGSPLVACALSNSLGDHESAVVAAALLRHGADRTLKKPRTGQDAVSYAENRKKYELIDVLKS